MVSVACEVWTRKKDADIAAKYIGYVNEARFGEWFGIWQLCNPLLIQKLNDGIKT